MDQEISQASCDKSHANTTCDGVALAKRLGCWRIHRFHKELLGGCS